MKSKTMDRFALPFQSWIWMGMSLALAAGAWACADRWSLPSEASARARTKLASLEVIDSDAAKPWRRGATESESESEYFEGAAWAKSQRSTTLDAVDAMMAESRALDWAAKQSVRLLSNKAAGSGARELVVLTMGPDGPLRCQLRYEWIGERRQTMVLIRQECAPKIGEGKARK